VRCGHSGITTYRPCTIVQVVGGPTLSLVQLRSKRVKDDAHKMGNVMLDYTLQKVQKVKFRCQDNCHLDVLQ